MAIIRQLGEADMVETKRLSLLPNFGHLKV